jgi:hypothetical protein
MPDKANLHWTEDEDLLAQYVLGRLSVEERTRLGDHLISCLRCREMVEREQELASGIRQLGRQELRARLRQWLAVTPDASRMLVPWQRVASAAAVVLIIGGVGIYNHWFTLGGRESISAPHDIQEAGKAPDEGGVKADDSQSKGTAIERQENRVESLRDHKTMQKPGTEQIQNSPSITSDVKIQSESNGGMKGTEKLRAPSSTGGGATFRKKDLRDEQNQILLERPHATQFWTEGVILRETEPTAKRFKAMEKSLVPNRTLTESKQSREAIRSPSSLEGRMIQGEIHLKLKNIQSLPLARQKLQQKNEETIQAYVQQSDHGTTMTLYLDTLYNEADLQTARIEHIAPDSIVIDLQSQKIGFTLTPNSLGSQKELQRAKEK